MCFYLDGNDPASLRQHTLDCGRLDVDKDSLSDVLAQMNDCDYMQIHTERLGDVQIEFHM